MKVIFKNSKLVFANLNGELIYDGNFTKEDANMYYVNLNNVAIGESYAVVVKANVSVMAEQQLDLYIKSGDNVVSNVVSLMNKTLQTDEVQFLNIIASGNSAKLRIYSARGYNDMVFTAKVIKLE